MPKPVKKALKRLPVPPKPKRPSDPNRAAHAMLAEHMARVQADPKVQPGQPASFTVKDTHRIVAVTPQESATFEEQFRARMAELGAKGGRKSGAKRMENLSDRQRREIAKKGANARWRKGD